MCFIPSIITFDFHGTERAGPRDTETRCPPQSRHKFSKHVELQEATINREEFSEGLTPSFLVYNLFFLLFAVSILFLPQSITGTARQFISSLLPPISNSARAAGEAVKSSVSGEDQGKTNDQVQELRAKLIEARMEIMELRSMLKMREELRRLEVNQTPFLYFTSIISIGESNPWRRSILIDRGRKNTGGKPPLTNGLAVTYGRQLIGRISEAGPSTSRVQLLTDPDFTLKVYAVPPEGELPENRDKIQRPKVYLSRRTGMIEGTGSRTLKLKDVFANVIIEEGWEVVTAGDPDDPIPRGLLVGTVNEVSDEYGTFLRISVKPSIHIEKISRALVLRPRGFVEGTLKNQ